jgi:hypothetical protein
MGRLGLAFRCFFRVLSGKPVPVEVLPEDLVPREAPALPPARESSPRTSPEIPVVQLLSLLQKEGRLLDFLQEEISVYDDAQVGAAVRNIHSECRRVLQEHVGLAPIINGHEDSTVTVDCGFDPSRIRLIGNVTGEPPFSGLLRHHGWRATGIKIPEPAAGHDTSVIAPAEVELP